MTDKQIIINGVDVSGCDFLAQKDDYCSYSGVTYAYKGQCMCSDEEMCKEHPKCFYKKVLKQLKAKEQECEWLKAEYTRVHTQLASQEAYILVDGEEVWSGSTRKLKQENEKLKGENENHKYKAEFFENYNDAYIDKITKLEKTLTEIKEIAEKKANVNDWLALEILQKISEVE